MEDKYKTFFDDLVEVTGSMETAQKVVRLFDRTRQSTKLTLQQQAVYDYLLSGKPVMSQRQLAKDCGLDHPQKVVAILAALVVKGYLVPKDVVDPEEEA